MHFAQAAKNEARKTFTENGATAYNTTDSALLDLFGSIGALRNADNTRIERLFADAYQEDPLLATKCLFYSRDVRGGLGERHTFRVLLKYAATYHSEAIVNNIPLIGLYGRYDDLYELIGTPLENNMWRYVADQLAADEEAMNAGKACSLLAKWLKTPDASSANTRKLGILTAKKIGLTVYVYKRKLRALRRYLKIVEVSMSANKWNEIQYASVPSKAMTIYRNAFKKHDEVRFNNFIIAVENGKEKINASVLYPYDIIEAYIKQHGSEYFGLRVRTTDSVLEAQWKAMPNFLDEPANAIVIADTSGSMCGRPMNSAVGLALYFAERNQGAYHGLWMSFSGDSKIQRIKGEKLSQWLNNMDTEHWGGNTNLERAFMHVLNIAIENNVSQEEMVKSIIVISDMEIDSCTGSWSFYDEMAKRYRAHGYTIPNVVFWNVDSRHDVFHADKNRKGVQLCSGQSASTFKHLMAAINMNPMEMMVKVLTGDRYKPVTLACPTVQKTPVRRRRVNN